MTYNHITRTISEIPSGEILDSSINAAIVFVLNDLTYLGVLESVSDESIILIDSDSLPGDDGTVTSIELRSSKELEVSNGLSTLWQGIVDNLNDNKDDLGIKNRAERAFTGKVTTLLPPSAAVWIKPDIAKLISQNGALTFPCDVTLFCASAPAAKEVDAVDGALEIAKKVLAHCTNLDVGGVILTQPDDEPVLEIVERSSTGAVVGILLKAEVTL